MPTVVKKSLSVKAFNFTPQELSKYLRHLRVPEPAHPNGMIAKIYDSALNYLNLGEFNPGSELYLVCAVLKKRMEVRFMLAGPAQNDAYHITDWRGNSKQGVMRLKPVIARLKDRDNPLNFTLNQSKHYISTFNMPLAIGVYAATRYPKQTDTQVDDYLVELYNSCNNAYHQGTSESTLSDYSFDQLRKYLIENKLIDAAKTGAPPAPGTKKIDLKTPLGSLENAFDGGELKNWFKRYPPNEVVVESNKIDGISGQVNYKGGVFQNANTKGDGYIGEDMTRLAKLVPDVPKRLKKAVDIQIRCEFFVKNSVFHKKYGANSDRVKPYANPRNMTAGLKNRKDPDPTIAKDVSVLGYSIIGSKLSKTKQLQELKALGFPIVPYKTVKVSDLYKQSQNSFQTSKAVADYDMDGLVYEIDNPKYRDDFIAGKINPKFAVAFKPETQTAQTTVVGLKWAVSKDRYVKPTAIIEPVKVSGATVTSVTLHNAKKVKDLRLGKGAVVEVQRSGDAIPHIKRVIKPAKVLGLPKDGEYGGWEWNSTGVDIVLSKGVQSDEHEIEKIVTFFSALKVEKFSEGLIKLFYEHGYKTIPDILHMTQADILKDIPRQGQTSAKNIITEFTKLKNPGVKLPDLMYASGCFGRGLGKSKFIDLYTEYGDGLVSGWSGMRLDDVATSIADIHGFSYATGKQFALGIKPYIDFYKSVKDVIYIRKQEKLKGGKLDGQVITPTDFRDKILGQKIENLGGTYSEGFSGKTTLLLVPALSSNSVKVQKAKAKGIDIMTRADFIKKYNLE